MDSHVAARTDLSPPLGHHTNGPVGWWRLQNRRSPGFGWSGKLCGVGGVVQVKHIGWAPVESSGWRRTRGGKMTSSVMDRVSHPLLEPTFYAPFNSTSFNSTSFNSTLFNSTLFNSTPIDGTSHLPKGGNRWTHLCGERLIPVLPAILEKFLTTDGFPVFFVLYWICKSGILGPIKSYIVRSEQLHIVPLFRRHAEAFILKHPEEEPTAREVGEKLREDMGLDPVPGKQLKCRNITPPHGGHHQKCRNPGRRPE